MQIFKLFVNAMLFCTCCTASIRAQEVVATSGEFYTNPNGSISWTLGEPISESFTANQQLFSQGFQQSAQNYAGISLLNNVDLFKIYPNPFDELIYLQNISKEKELILILYDQKMSVVQKNTIQTGFDTESIVSFQNLAAGIYFLRIQSSNGKIDSMQKLIKKTL